tara:strand:+ start:1618 stop:1920 length:303 start_codon:yes stop_codon:yes gene_type:complete
MRNILFIAVFLLAGCAQKWEPVVDPRASKEPKEIIRDQMECERLIAMADKYAGVPTHERNDFKFLGVKFCWTDCDKTGLPYDYNPLARCLSNRGHSIINW